jgi:hypothetical protein
VKSRRNKGKNHTAWKSNNQKKEPDTYPQQEIDMKEDAKRAVKKMCVLNQRNYDEVDEYRAAVENTYGPFFPATTFICWCVTFCFFWIHNYGYFQFKDLNEITYISIWSFEPLRFVGSRYTGLCYVAPGPFKVGGSIISLILMWLPDPQNQPEAYHTFAALNGLCVY